MLLESLEFYRSYCKKYFWSHFFPEHTVQS